MKRLLSCTSSEMLKMDGQDPNAIWDYTALSFRRDI